MWIDKTALSKNWKLCDFECIVTTALSDLRNVQEQYLYSWKVNGITTDSGKNAAQYQTFTSVSLEFIPSVLSNTSLPSTMYL